MILGAIGLAPVPAALAAAPVDHRSLGPNDPSELPGAGFLLTDPYQGASRAYWAGAYRSVAGQRSYCIDDYYDYPEPGYGYRTTEVASLPGRPGSNQGAYGHDAARIAWIVNRYGASGAATTDAEVSMAINLLMHSAPFNRSYYGYFVAQLNAIDSGIVPAINRMLAESDRSAGPYRVEVRMGPSPGVGGTGRFDVLVRSAHGIALPWVPVTVRPSAGMRLLSPAPGSTGHSAVASFRYVADTSGTLSIAVTGRALPNPELRLGYSPSHSSANFGSGSQRVALVSSRPLIWTPPAGGHVVVHPPALHTVVDGGSVARRPGEPVTDQVSVTGLAAGISYKLQATLQDSAGTVCGSTSTLVHSDRAGRLDAHTGPVPVCGSGTDTFSERLLIGQVLVGSSPPGQPAETFVVTPVIRTAVAGGNGARPQGTAVSDHVQMAGLPARALRLLVVLMDATGRPCAHVSVPITPDAGGAATVLTPSVKACGVTRNTFVEQVLDAKGTVLVASAPWLPAETFPLAPPAPSAPRSPMPTRPPTAGGPTPQLALTGMGSRLALVGGLLSLGVGGLLLVASRRT